MNRCGRGRRRDHRRGGRVAVPSWTWLRQPMHAAPHVGVARRNPPPELRSAARSSVPPGSLMTAHANSLGRRHRKCEPGDGFDAGIRLGEMIAEDMITVRLTPPFRAILGASPAYLSERGRPNNIADLKNHNCIAYRLIKSGGLYRWELLDDGREVAVEATGNTVINDPMYALDLARAGVGLAYVMEPVVRADIAAGHLTQVLAQVIQRMARSVSLLPKACRVGRRTLRAFIDNNKRSPATSR